MGDGQETEENQRITLDSYKRIYEELEKWRDPKYLEDGYLIPPTIKSINSTKLMLSKFEIRGFPIPDRILPNSDGGVCLEYFINKGKNFSIEIEREGKIETLLFED